MNFRLCLILWVYFDSFCSGRAKSRCGGVLAVISDRFYHQHSFEFHTFRTVILWFLLTLTSSTSFGEYLNSGTRYPKFGQNGRNPRPTGRPIPHGVWCSSLVRVLMSANASQSNVVSYKIHKPRPKGLSHDKMGPRVVLQLNPKLETVYEKNTQPLINTSVDRRAEKGQA